jgi:malic enzyme
MVPVDRDIAALWILGSPYILGGLEPCGQSCWATSSGSENIIMFDSKGLLHVSRKNLNKEKKEFAINASFIPNLEESIKDSDVFI